MTGGYAGWGSTPVRCPAGHELTAVYRNAADGALWAPRLDLDTDAAQEIACHKCERVYLVDPVALRRAARSGRRKFGVSRPQ